MLPKVHKPNNPGRPVVPSVNRYTEKLSAYLDEFIRPLDVSSLYTNNYTNEGLTVVENEFKKAGRNNPSGKTLACLLEKVPKLNNFTFNQEHFIQVKGTAMGTKAAPNFVNLYMGRLEDTFVYQTDWSNYVIDWIRLIDDIFLIWNGNYDSLTTFIGYLNRVVPSIKFTHEISYHSVNFLDTKVLKDARGDITTDVYQKPTDTHPYLHWTSAHPPHLKHSIPYSLRRICLSTETLRQRIMEYSQFFVACGYKRERVLTEIRKVLSLKLEESLEARERVSINRMPLETTFNPHTFIAEIANRNWHLLQSKERLAHIFQEAPLIAYRRPKGLRDTLVSIKFRNTTTGGNHNIAGGCGPCNKPRCSWCNRINKTSTFSGTQNCKLYDIFHTMDCQSAWVIYVIECKICKLQYVGKSETGFKLRLNNHRNHIKSKLSSCELTEHFLHNTRTHNCDNDARSNYNH